MSRLMGFLGADAAQVARGVPVADLQTVRRTGMEAYELVEQLDRGPARLAAWNAYVLQTYGDKLLSAGVNPSFVSFDTAQLAGSLFSLAGWWVEQASELAGNPTASSADHLRDPLPHFHAPTRSHDQLVALRQTLDALQTYVAYDLNSLGLDGAPEAAFRAQLAAIESCSERASMLWIERAPPEIRDGIGDELTRGIDKAYALGQALAKRT